MRVHSFTFKGKRLVYERAGSGSPIVFLHNLGSSRLIWKRQVEQLMRTHDVVALDMLGYGDSDRGERSEYTLENYADALAALIDELRFDKVALVGNCVGSATALSYAARNPGRVSALVLANPATYDTIEWRPLGLLIRLGNRLPALARAISPLSRVALPKWVATAIVKQQIGQAGKENRVLDEPHIRELRDLWTRPGALQPTVDSDIAANFATAFVELDRMSKDADFPPICTIWGAQNAVLSPRRGQRLNQSVLQPERDEVLADSGHLPMVEEPDRVTAIITDFITEHHAHG